MEGEKLQGRREKGCCWLVEIVCVLCVCGCLWCVCGCLWVVCIKLFMVLCDVVVFVGVCVFVCVCLWVFMWSWVFILGMEVVGCVFGLFEVCGLVLGRDVYGGVWVLGVGVLFGMCMVWDMVWGVVWCCVLDGS